MNRFDKLLANVLKDMTVALSLVILFFCTRVAFLIIFNAEYSGLAEIPSLLFGAIRFDGRFALMGIAPLLLLSLAGLVLPIQRFQDRFRVYYGSFACVLTVFWGIANLFFFAEYHDQFNQWVLGLWFDDARSLIVMIWQQYPVIWVTLGLLTLFWTMSKLFRSALSLKIFNVRLSFISLLVVLFVIKCSVTGTLGWRTLSRKDTSLTSDAFLNKLVYNPYYALYSVYRDYSKRSGVGGFDLYWDEDINSALAELTPHGLTHVSSSVSLKNKPQHIFLIVMESQDGWPLLSHYHALDLNPELSTLKKKAFYLENFVSAGVGTMPALNSLILGTPEVGLETQYQAFAQKPSPTSIPELIRPQGYSPQLFYGGYLSWRKLGELAQWQGFEAAYGQAHIAAAGKRNAWGVEDRDLFDFIKESIQASTQNTFNLIMTTSNHPPYSIDLDAEGFAWKGNPETEDSLKKILGHSWYGDRCVGEFVRKMSEQYPSALFVITGDHWSRKHILERPPLKEQKIVPLIIYTASEDLSVYNKADMLGTHLDIMPTVLDLLSSLGEQTPRTMGQSIFSRNPKEHVFGADVVVGADGTVQMPDEASAVIARKYRAQRAVGWWRIMKEELIK